MSRKSALGAFCAGNGALEITTRRIAGQQHRTFTSTASRHATHITQFTPTSSKALDELLSNIRRKIILPSYLPLAQRKRIYSPKHAKTLESDPIIIEIDGEVLRFGHMNPLLGDIPETRRSVLDVVSRFATDADFANLKPLLEGIAHTGYRFSPSFHAKILRLCGTRGHVYAAIECARAVRTTGLRLDSSEKANELLHFIQLRAADAGFAVDETAQALRWAEMVVDMLVDEQHLLVRRKDERPVDGELPPDRDPQVLLARLHLAAAVARNQVRARDENPLDDAAAGGPAAAAVEKADEYGADIARLWPEDRPLRSLQPSSLYEDHDKMGYLLEPNKFITLATPLLHGLDVAAAVVARPGLADQLRARRDTLAAEIQAARETYGVEKPERWNSIYRKFYGETA